VLWLCGEASTAGVVDGLDGSYPQQTLEKKEKQVFGTCFLKFLLPKTGRRKKPQPQAKLHNIYHSLFVLERNAFCFSLATSFRKLGLLVFAFSLQKPFCAFSLPSSLDYLCSLSL
jgi:hypothetical protein